MKNMMNNVIHWPSVLLLSDDLFVVFVQVEALIPDPATVNNLVEMGFPLEACKKAAYHTNNAGKLGY